MHKIYFIRHAKAQKENKDTSKDFSRELTSRGKENAKFMAQRLLKHKIIPNAIFSSSAKRCEQTAKIISQNINFKHKIILKDELYDISTDKLIEFVQNLDEDIKEVFIILHNPSITEISELLSDSFIGNIPTSGIFCVKIKTTFNQIKEGSAKALFFDYPKKHKK
ncbi:histidine phosphatase family protein [Campylobacter sp. RM9344]|uniref:Histidine phosphatase family protein n=1 Tax=Campylobacter californiensis TaxID=1032243 RepID=A0AAW3ZSH3_9BACT|nr:MULTISPECIES: histidine phosphatase family protein [unclassified Campylobacter]MBE2984249.1 histidine phosphatase family protein [Campylobacter sp. RM6883]MBE2994884.1 histidine phosphatase family protein [Campylobacter sp. RM6913]MBE3029478.1 histidine phosphatase family protein [Campylobacter sp. RM9344]MBE3608015.1 histidine phosphatase family protein [Campylobacter sp. RM9337]QCD50818.1 phosphohistidine phosphatase [Campylobacter sp. RM6914]